MHRQCVGSHHGDSITYQLLEVRPYTLAWGPGRTASCPLATWHRRHPTMSKYFALHKQKLSRQFPNHHKLPSQRWLDPIFPKFRRPKLLAPKPRQKGLWNQSRSQGRNQPLHNTINLPYYSFYNQSRGLIPNPQPRFEEMNEQSFMSELVDGKGWWNSRLMKLADRDDACFQPKLMMWLCENAQRRMDWLIDSGDQWRKAEKVRWTGRTL